MIGFSVATVAFVEPSLKAEVPACTPIVTAAFLCGFQFMPPPHTNHEDVLIGVERLQQFKDAKAAQLRREVRFHFIGRTVEIDGEHLSIHDFVQRWQQDAAFQRARRAHPKFTEACFKMSQKLAAASRAVLAIDRGDESRVAYGRIGGDKSTLLAMTRFHDNGV